MHPTPKFTQTKGDRNGAQALASANVNVGSWSIRIAGLGLNSLFPSVHNNNKNNNIVQPKKLFAYIVSLGTGHMH